MSDQPVEPCFLCGSREFLTVDSLRPSQINHAWAHMGAKLPAAATDPFDHVQAIHLHRCRSCGFLQFSPVLPGNSAFYSELQRQIPNYYPPHSPSFHRAIDLARRMGVAEVIDLGCGAGAFLDMARAAGLATRGLDLNATAVAACRARGHDVLNATAEQFAGTHPEQRFRLVTSFEVMEHVPNPARFFHDAANLLQPGGYLAIAVPNEDGIHGHCPLEPHQWPPHHLTRWRRQDLDRLGRMNGLEVVNIEADLLRGAHMHTLLNLQRELEVLLGRRPAPAGRWWPEIATFLFRITLCRHFVRRGLSLHAHYRKPA
jgi:2-polyprenyl-3-methyl-5-hydroxy-6-metoxy-1,4-benzoquinol methylase